MALGITQKTVVLNQFGLSERIRTTSKGTSSRYTISIKAQPLVLLFDAKALGQAPAEAMATVIKQKIRGISETVTPATDHYRKRAKVAFQQGVGWAKKRYGGLYIPPAASIAMLPNAQGKRSNRLPPMEPGQTVRFWNDSGRFVQGLVARPTRNNDWTINIAANRLDPVTFRGGREALLAAYERLVKLVPELADPRALEKNPEVRRAIGEATDSVLFGLLGQEFNRQKDLRAALRQGRLDAARALLGGLGQIVSTFGV
jgi:hypothetical protein